MKSGTVIIEFKNGKYDPRTTEDVHGATEVNEHGFLE